MKKILLITGASTGIGAVTAQHASRAGYCVCINYLRNHAAAGAILASIEQEGGEAYLFQADVSDETQVKIMFETIDRKVGTITALVNNAGIIEPQQKLSQMSAERLQKVFATNVIGSFLCGAKLLIECLRRRVVPVEVL